jgi:hypothetical protein
MTAGMALARALHQVGGSDALDAITHIGGNSGGSFFNNQFLYSADFFKNVTDADLPLDALVTDWLKQHVAALQGLMDKKGPLEKEFGEVGLAAHSEPGVGCAALNPIQHSIFNGLSKAAKYPLRWLPLVAAAVLKNSLGEKAGELTYADMNRTLSGAALVSQITLPPDAWTTHNDKTKHTDILTLHAAMKDGSSVDLAKEARALPVAFVSAGRERHGWFYDPDIVNLTVAPKCPYTGVFSKKKCGQPPYTPSQQSSLPLPEHPLIAEVTAASGGSTGFAGSPTVYGTIAKKFVAAVEHGLGHLLGPILSEVVDCWPYGAQVLSPPMMRPKTTVAESEANVPYRYMDGGYAENTALPMTLAAAQRDCKAGLLDCKEPIRLIMVNDGNISSHHTGFGTVQAKDPLRSLFADPDTPVGTFVPGMFGSIQVPVQTVFAEQFPAASEWVQYNDFPSKRRVGPLLSPLKHKWVDESIKSMMWSGTVTTVENKHFGVTAGQKVQLLVFSLEIPGVIWPGLGDPAQTEIVSPGHLRIADGAVMKDADLIAGHAPMAKAQAEAFVPVLKKFLTPAARSVYV